MGEVNGSGRGETEGGKSGRESTGVVERKEAPRRRDAGRGCRAPSVLDSSGPMTAMFVGRNGKGERNAAIETSGAIENKLEKEEEYTRTGITISRIDFYEPRDSPRTVRNDYDRFLCSRRK